MRLALVAICFWSRYILWFSSLRCLSCICFCKSAMCLLAISFLTATLCYWSFMSATYGAVNWLTRPTLPRTYLLYSFWRFFIFSCSVRCFFSKVFCIIISFRRASLFWALSSAWFWILCCSLRWRASLSCSTCLFLLTSNLAKVTWVGEL